MSAINLLLAVLGGGITVMVAIGMVFLAPRGVEPRVETPIEPPTAREEPATGVEIEVAPPA